MSQYIHYIHTPVNCSYIPSYILIFTLILQTISALFSLHNPSEFSIHVGCINEPGLLVQLRRSLQYVE